MVQYLPILLLLVLVAVLFARRLCPSSRPGSWPTGGRPAAKEGPTSLGSPRHREPSAALPAVRFYLVAMIFIIFDIEVIFLYPWAVMYRQLSTFGLAEMAAFAVVVFIAFAYLVSPTVRLDWGPPPASGWAGSGPWSLSPRRAPAIRRCAGYRRPVELIGGPAPLPLDDDIDEDDDIELQPVAPVGQQAQSA